MVDVGRNDHAGPGNFVADQLRRQLLALGDEEHLFGQQALAGEVHLRHVGVAGARSFLSPLAVAAIASTHNLRALLTGL
jgi:hypothetical protein